MTELSTKPYLIRALHDWCTDSGYTPHIVVNVDENTVVPMDFVQDGKITLNISYLSTNGLEIGNDYIEFQARFNGVVEDLFIPVAAVSGIFARETGTGMGFEVSESAPYPAAGQSPSGAGRDEAAPGAESDEKTRSEKSSERAPHLRIIK